VDLSLYKLPMAYRNHLEQTDLFRSAALPSTMLRDVNNRAELCW